VEEEAYSALAHWRTNWPAEQFQFMPMNREHHWWLGVFDMEDKLAYVYDSKQMYFGRRQLRKGEVEAAVRAFEAMRPVQQQQPEQQHQQQQEHGQQGGQEGGEGEGDTRQRRGHLLSEEWESIAKGWHVRHMGCPQQRRESDCGVHVMQFMMHLFCAQKIPVEDIPPTGYRKAFLREVRGLFQGYIEHRVPLLMRNQLLSRSRRWNYGQVSTDMGTSYVKL